MSTEQLTVLGSFLEVVNRALAPGLPTDLIAGRHRAALVTGGTGCIGRVLVRDLAAAGVEVTSLSRRPPDSQARVPGARYLTGDVRDRSAVRDAYAAARPTIVFHLAAQRDPGLAEVEVPASIATNVLGTAVVLEEAAAAGVRAASVASTGKAMRYFTPDVYAGSKKLVEALAGTISSRTSLVTSVVRFTHVVDNSIVYRRLCDWAAEGRSMRLHAQDIWFFVQSAREASQLLQVGGALCDRGVPTVLAIEDLGQPVALTELAQDIAAQAGRNATLEYIGYEPGYSDAVFPGTYGPDCLGRSPLLNRLEVGCPGFEARSSWNVNLCPNPADECAPALPDDPGATGAHWRAALVREVEDLWRRRLRAVRDDELLKRVEHNARLHDPSDPVQRTMYQALRDEVAARGLV